MKDETAGDVAAFQKWLSQSIRRTWILAFAIAIPGALLVTLWFPHSGLALVIVGLTGVAVGVVADAVERARERKAEDTARIVAAVHQAFQDALKQDPTTEDESAELERLRERLSTSEKINVLRGDVLDEMRALRGFLIALVTKVAPEYLWQTGASKESQPPPAAKYGLGGFDPLFWKEDPLPLQKYWVSHQPALSHYAEVLMTVERLTLERGIPMASFLRYAQYLASKPELMSQLHQTQSEQTH